MTLRLDLLGTLFEIETEEADVAALLARLWEPFVTGSAAPPDQTYTIGRDEGGLGVETPGTTPLIHHPDPWGLTDALRYQMLELVEARLRGFVTLHAGAVAREGRLLLLAGASGAGKTTLTLGLLRAGWTYFTDDLAPIDVTTAEIAPFPKPLGVKDPAAFDGLAGAFDGIDLPRPAKAFLVPPDAFPVGTGPLAARCLVFPTFRAGAAVGVTALTAAKATALATAYVRRLEPEVVALLNRVCTGCDCYEVVYGSTEAGVAAATGVALGRTT